MSIEVTGLCVRRERQEILQELIHSIEKTNVLGISLKGQEDLITTAVVGLRDSATGDKIVTLRDYDLHGYPLSRSEVFLSEIKSVIPFKTLFNDPVYMKIREMKGNQRNNVAA